jgi:hypothetical protein
MNDDDDDDDYCYFCGYDHDNPSHGSWPEKYCDYYEEYISDKGESK